MKSLKQYFYESNLSNDSDEFENPLSDKDIRLCRQYIDLYDKLNDIVAKINKIAQPLYKKHQNNISEFRKSLNADDQAAALGMQCSKLIDKIYTIAEKINNDDIRESLTGLLEVPTGSPYTQYPEPSNFSFGGEFTIVATKDLEKAINDYQNGEEFYIEM